MTEISLIVTLNNQFTHSLTGVLHGEVEIQYNKWPKVPHNHDNVHLSTMCHRFGRRFGQGVISCFSHPPEKNKLGRGRWDLASCQVSLNSIQRFQMRSRKCLSQSKTGAAILFSDRPEKHKLGRGRCDLASFQVSLNSVQRFQKRSKKYLSESEAGRPSCFSDRPEKHKRVQARIQEFSSGGPTFRKILISKKKKGGGGGGGGFSIYSALVWSKSIFCHWNSFTDNNFYKYEILRCFLQAKPHSMCWC